MIIEQDYLEHYGILRKSGRYPWGSGDTASTRSKSFLGNVADLRREGLSDKEIAEGFGMSIKELREARSMAVNQQRQDLINQAQRLRDKGTSYTEIGRIMGKNESSVRALLAPGRKDKANILTTTSNMLRDQVDKKKMIDVGLGVENEIGITQTRLNTAVALLKEEGYGVHSVQIRALGTGLMTTTKVLCQPGITKEYVNQHRGDIKLITAYSKDGGRTALGILPPMSISSKRVGIRYAEDGGADADGVIYVRPGVPDIELGGNRYAQVRIAVDGTHYLKGMAVYKNDLPKGQDLVFNTNKSNTGNKKDAMKQLSDDPDNPFGSFIRRQITVKNSDGTDRLTSVMNIVNEEGSWEKWKKSLASQVLSKQSPELAKSQLDMLYDRKRSEFDEIQALTHPTVRRLLLNEFAGSADSSAVHLEAASMPKQASYAILPSTKIRENEVFAPGNFRDGERVVLIRYPHAGPFEIPELRVNNKNRDARDLIGLANDAIVIHPNVAKRLSGADFDGDTVLVIKNDFGAIKTSPALEGLKNFDPRSSYPPFDGMKTIDGGTWNAKTRSVDYGSRKPNATPKQHEMGKITNLITDMTIKGASQQEIARAVRHSMVVIDSENHHLNYQASAIDNGIPELKIKYQGSARAGATTLISRARAKVYVDRRRPRPMRRGGPVDPLTGKKVFEPTGETYINKAGKRVPRQVVSRRLAETEDAHTLVSTPGTPMERIYADHSNRLKSLANEARKEALNTGTIPYSPSASRAYAEQVASLDASLNRALRNAPRERNAQAIAGAVYRARVRANPDMDEAEKKKIRNQALAAARSRTGAERSKVIIKPTQEEWNAIQAGAISNHKLVRILDNADSDTIRALATPHTRLLMTPVKIARAQRMFANGYTQAEIADALGVSVTTLKTSLREA